MRLDAAMNLGLFLFMLIPFSAIQEMPDFGPDGTAGLTVGQVQRLAQGEIILPEGLIKTSQGKSLIAAALVFDRPPEEVWRLLSETEVQGRYLTEVKSVRVIRKTETEDCLEFTVRVMGKTVVYRQIHNFDSNHFYFHWVLDPTFRGDVKELIGFWRFYPYDDGRTLARYGSRVKPRFPVPDFIREALAKGHVRSALESVKRYVDSGGAWKKSQEKD
jgi:hypothetical protein